MVLTDLRLQNYRSYTDSSFELGAGVNIVVGPNAAGKTNLLEAIMVSCIGKSYRTKDINLIRTDQEWARIDAHTSESGLRTVKLQLDPATAKLLKTFEIDDKPYKRLLQSHKIPVVLFEPNDLQLIESEPSLRRNYLDDLIEQYVPGFERTRTHYRRALAQRNALLKHGGRSASQLFAWNLRLVDLADKLVSERLKLIDSINLSLGQIYQSVAKGRKDITARYESSIDVNNYSTQLLKKLEASVETDIARGFTGHGPHRDDLVVYFGDHPALLSASRGEIRTLLLAIKIIELQLLEEKHEVRPLLLLDDVFSELDGARRKALTKHLNDYQTIITTTDADIVVKNFNNHTIIPIEKD